jgi:hypothetical protein
MVILTTGVMFLLFTCMQLFGEFYDGGSRVRRPLKKWFAIAESLRNTVLKGTKMTASQKCEVEALPSYLV